MKQRNRVNGKDKTKDEFHFHLKEEDKDLFWFEKPPVSLLFTITMESPIAIYKKLSIRTCCKK